MKISFSDEAFFFFNESVRFVGFLTFASWLPVSAGDLSKGSEVHLLWAGCCGISAEDQSLQSCLKQSERSQECSGVS